MALRMRLSTSPRSLSCLVCLSAVALGMPAGLLACWPTTAGTTTGSTSTSALPTTDAPVITDLNMSASILTPTKDMYTITGVITYSDDDDVVVKAEVEVPVLGKTYPFNFANPVSDAFGETITFQLSADPPLGGAGPTNYILTLVNASGAVSAGVEESMDLE
jgi:hypothetical protein